MLDLSTDLASTVIFLFSKPGSLPIGTAFLIGFPVPNKPNTVIPLVVTAKHVLGSNQKVYARFSTKEGKEPALVEYDLDSLRKNGDLWEHADKGVDISVFRTSTYNTIQYTYIDLNSIAKKNTLHDEDIKVTDRVIFPCLLVNFLGFKKNYPITRDGTIALIPGEVVPLEYVVGNKTIQTKQEIILIDAISIPGASGSPIFLWPGPRLKNNTFNIGGQVPFLLGVMHGFYNAFPREIKEVESSTKGYFSENSGIAIVFPSWKIIEILELPAFKTKMNALFKDIK